MKIHLFISLFLSISLAHANLELNQLDIQKNKDFRHNAQDDFLTSLEYLTRGAYLQFTDYSNLVIAGVATAFFFATNVQDKEWSAKMRTHRVRHTESTISDIGIIVNTPVVPLTTYYVARNIKNEKLLKYSQEYFAALNLALMETAIISFIPIHKRPTPDNLTVWEENFRHESSFPSGHTIGWWIMTFKTGQYYGPFAAAVPASLALITSGERVRTNKHYLSDVIGSLLVSYMAHKGVERAANSDKETAFSRFLKKHQPQLGFIKEEDKQGLKVSLSY